MYQKKANQKEKPESKDYIIHHGSLPVGREWPDRGEGTDHAPKYFQIVSVDPATDNYSIRIERRWSDGRTETIVQNKVAFNRAVDENCNSVFFDELEDMLSSYTNFYWDVDIFMVEKQMPLNYRAVRVSQHTITHFLKIARENERNQCVIEWGSRLKKKMLGPKKRLTDTELKSWAYEYALLLADIRRDAFLLQILKENKKKGDDIADTVIQIDSLFSLLGFPVEGITVEKYA